jgi:hypothetical protein
MNPSRWALCRGDLHYLRAGMARAHRYASQCTSHATSAFRSSADAWGVPWLDSCLGSD